jgi:hypothetical protein
MSLNISYIDDEEEMARRSIQPPPAVTLPAPAFLETAQDKEDRLRQQKLLDEERKKKEDRYEEYKDLFATDFPKAIAAVYSFLSQSIITDLERTLENISPPTTNVITLYRVMRERLTNKWGPNNQKDATENKNKLASLHGDHRGWDVLLASQDTILENLSKTPVRDASGNPVMEPIPTRPHLPRPPPTANLVELLAFIANDTNDQAAWELLHPSNKIKNHRPTDEAIMSNVMLALGTSIFTPYSNLAQRYRQTDHAAKTWPDLRADIELIISNNSLGTSREPNSLLRNRDRPPPREWHPSPFTPNHPYQDSRSSRTTHDDHHNSRRHPARDDNHSQDTHDVRAASPSHLGLKPATKHPYPCSNCGSDHRAYDCDNPKCFICGATFATPALRQDHYLSVHKRDNKRTRFGPDQPQRSHYTPPTSPFLSRSAEDMNHTSPYDSGHDSTYSNASGPGQPPSSSRGNSDMEDQAERYLFEQRSATIVPTPEDAANATGSLPHNNHTIRAELTAALIHRLMATLPPHITTDDTLHQLALQYVVDIAHSDQAHHPSFVLLPHTLRRDLLNPVTLARLTDPMAHSPTTPRDDISDTDSSMPSLIPDSDDDYSDHDDHDNDTTLTTNTAPPSDDDINRINRSFVDSNTRTQRPVPGHPLIYDIRTATHDEDGSDTDPEPIYWPEGAPPSPPRNPEPPPTVITA